MTGSPTSTPSDAQLARPIDQFQRYQLTASLVRSLGVPPGARILDVGGAPGPVEDFLPDYEVVVTDLDGDHAGRYVVADGSRLPFADRAFAAVVSLDTLEHVPPDRRAPFLSEALRVAEHAVVLSAPFASPDVVLAEKALREFISLRLSPTFPTAVWLQEHEDNGLPVLQETVASLGAGDWSSTSLASGYLPHWLATMVVDHELLATGLPQLDRLHAYYNSEVSPTDAREPAYRHIVAAARHRSAEQVQAAVDALKSTGDVTAGRAGVLAMASSLMARRVDGSVRSATDEQVSAAEARVVDLSRELADRDAHLLELRQQLDQMRLDAAERDRQHRELLTSVLDQRPAAQAKRLVKKAAHAARKERS